MVNIERKDGEFSARVGTLVLHKGKGTKAINRCHDIKDAIDNIITFQPISVETELKSERRFYFAAVNGVLLSYSSNANRVYEFCDELNRLLGLTPSSVKIVGDGYTDGVPNSWKSEDDRIALDIIPHPQPVLPEPAVGEVHTASAAQDRQP